MTEEEKQDRKERLECLTLVMECGAENDRRDPLKKAEELCKWVKGGTAKVPKKEEA